jgi:hypothetical protein
MQVLKFQSYGAQCSIKLHHCIVSGSMLLNVHNITGHSYAKLHVFIDIKLYATCGR